MLDFKELKLTYEHIAAAIGKGQEPTEELIAVKRYLEELSANHSEFLGRGDQAPGENALPADHVRYLLEDFSPGLIRKMCRERSRDDQVSTTISGFILFYSTLRCAASC